MKTIMIKILLCGLLLVSPAYAAPTSASLAEDMSNRHEKIISELKILRQTQKISYRLILPLVQKEISPIIDYTRFSAQAVGKHWRKTSKGDKQKIVLAFTNILENVYAKLLEKYDGQEIEIAEHKTRADDSVVVGVHVISGQRKVRIDYIFKVKGEEAKIVDVQVENISFLSTYRRQFGQIIKKFGIENLPGKLKALLKNT
ncbi:MAG: MlaC/ttg2D family ABC transporter substrate-binding protein [Gammaproteobacteria bacterium WSBS_2016_MAG_OTU1]